MVTGETSNETATFQAWHDELMTDWRLDVAGKPYDITAESLPNGRITVRVNGRIVAPPQAPDRVDCRFQLGPETFHLSGTSDDLKLDPVVVEAPVRLFQPLDLRAAVFLIVGTILFLVAGCSFVGTRMRDPTADERAAIESSQLENMFAIASAMRFAFGIEAAVGLLAVTAAAMLIRRLRSALFLMDIAAWAIVGGALLGFLLIDVFAHRQLDAVNDPALAAHFIRMLHTISYIVLIVFGLASGVLSSFLNRKEMEQLLE
jgi:hypothetical protein